jgi:two-component sensor histidine kinase
MDASSATACAQDAAIHATNHRSATLPWTRPTIEEDPVTGAKRRGSLAEAIVDTVREPLIVLDGSMRVVVASRSFYSAFNVTCEETEGRRLYDLGNGQWNISSLRKLLEEIIPHHANVEAYEVEHDFPTIGRRTLLLNARKIFYEENESTSLLVAFEDITESRALEREKDMLLQQKDLLLREMNHRINNSLQIIASILMLKAQKVPSEDTRQHLRDAHARVMAVATVQGQLNPSTFGTQIEASIYLKKLGESLARSMIFEEQPVSLSVEAGAGAMKSEHAVSMGLVTTELVMNALKHAFPGGAKGAIVVKFESTESAWRLSVSDDGVGIGGPLAQMPVRIGLGTSIVEALTRQLGGRVTTSSASPGTVVSVTVPRNAVTDRRIIERKQP